MQPVPPSVYHGKLTTCRSLAYFHAQLGRFFGGSSAPDNGGGGGGGGEGEGGGGGLDGIFADATGSGK
jgi:hypothetical protein